MSLCMMLNQFFMSNLIQMKCTFRAGFIYRITPQLSVASGGGNFFTPFDINVWIASSIIMVIVLIVLKLVTLILFRTLASETNTPLAAHLVDVVGTIAQQGIPSHVSQKIPIRITLLSLLLLNVVLYNYYTSSVVGGLLSSPGKGPETIKEIIESPLTLSFRDIGYHKILFRVSPLLEHSSKQRAVVNQVYPSETVFFSLTGN